MIFEIISTSQFKKDLKRALRRKNDVTLFTEVNVHARKNDQDLPPSG